MSIKPIGNRIIVNGPIFDFQKNLFINSIIDISALNFFMYEENYILNIILINKHVKGQEYFIFLGFYYTQWQIH